MRRLGRLNSDQAELKRTLRFPLAVLRSGPVLPLKPTDSAQCPVAVADDVPWPWELLDDMRRVFKTEVTPVIAPKDAILMSLNQAFDMASASAEQMVEDMGYNELSREIEEAVDLLDSENEAPVIRLVNTLLSQALKERASDIHIEPFEARVLVRFRVDGVLHTVVHPPKGCKPPSPVVSRLWPDSISLKRGTLRTAGSGRK